MGSDHLLPVILKITISPRDKNIHIPKWKFYGDKWPDWNAHITIKLAHKNLIEQKHPTEAFYLFYDAFVVSSSNLPALEATLPPKTPNHGGTPNVLTTYAQPGKPSMHGDETHSLRKKNCMEKSRNGKKKNYYQG